MRLPFFFNLQYTERMQSFTSPLQDPSLMIVFAYAPAGLGHLRVTDALYHGLPKHAQHPLLLGSQNTSITLLHRITSLNPIIRPLGEWIETGPLEKISTHMYTRYLRSHTKLLFEQLLTIIEERFEKPNTVLIIATHFALAHQLTALKQKVFQTMGIQLIVIVQVTDDYPHPVWAVQGADLIVVPSERTKTKLLSYLKKTNARIAVNPYPLSPSTNIGLSDHQIIRRHEQANPKSTEEIRCLIPISGAAVGTDYFYKLTETLHTMSSRFIFHIVVKDAPFTKKFISQMVTKAYVHLAASDDDRQVIEKYEQVYEQNIIGFEITKPSEQSFKALLSCDKRGAPILLFTEPVGSQEANNLSFLSRHNLIPTIQQQEHLWRLARKQLTIEKDNPIKLEFPLAYQWRGICLPTDPGRAAHFIEWCFYNGLFQAMISSKAHPDHKDMVKHEVQANGVETFWELVSQIVSEKQKKISY